MAKATAAVEFMYDKQATIKRYEEFEKPSGASGMDWVPKHVNVPCRISTLGSSSLNNTDQEDANKIIYDEKLILSRIYDIRAGDEVIVNEVDDGVLLSSVKYESTRKPFVYVSHQEVLLKFKGYA